MTRAPVLFVSHGAPTLALEGGAFAEALAGFAASLPRPRAVAIVSAHLGEGGPLGVTSAARNRIVHDFSGFPEPLYAIRYPAPGAPDVAQRVAALLDEAGIGARLDPDRPLDHGAWVPLRFLFPGADVPVVQVALSPTPDGARRLGAVLAPLRDEGVLLVASGGLVHNLRRVRLWEEASVPPDPWAVRFDAWCAERIAALDAAGLARFQDAPDAALAAPTPEHFLPVLVALGAAREGDRVETLHDAIDYGNLGMRTFALRPGDADTAP